MDLSLWKANQFSSIVDFLLVRFVSDRLDHSGPRLDRPGLVVLIHGIQLESDLNTFWEQPIVHKNQRLDDFLVYKSLEISSFLFKDCVENLELHLTKGKGSTLGFISRHPNKVWDHD